MLRDRFVFENPTHQGGEKRREEERRGEEGSDGYEVYLRPPFGSSDPTDTQSLTNADQ